MTVVTRRWLNRDYDETVRPLHCPMVSQRRMTCARACVCLCSYVVELDTRTMQWEQAAFFQHPALPGIADQSR